MENYMEKKMQELLESQGYYTGMPVKQTPATDVLTESEEELFEAMTRQQIGMAALLAGIGVLAIVGGFGAADLVYWKGLHHGIIDPQLSKTFIGGFWTSIAGGPAIILSSIVTAVAFMFNSNRTLKKALGKYYPQYSQDIRKMDSLLKQAKNTKSESGLQEFNRVAETFKNNMQKAADAINVDPDITPKEKEKISQLAKKFYAKQKKQIVKQAKSIQKQDQGIK